MSRVVRRITREVRRVVGSITGATAAERAAKEQTEAINKAAEEEAARAKALEEQRKREEEYQKAVAADTEALQRGEMAEGASTSDKGLGAVTTEFTSTPITQPDEEDKLRKALLKFGR